MIYLVCADCLINSLITQYLCNLDPNSAYYDPKMRSMRESLQNKRWNCKQVRIVLFLLSLKISRQHLLYSICLHGLNLVFDDFVLYVFKLCNFY